MANYTPNYGLHQWEPEDHFLRTDFNADFAKLDTALGALHDRAETAERALSPISYNLYNLMLQNDYDAKYTGYKKAMLYDGFQNDSGISALSDQLILQSNPPALKLYAQGQSDVSQNYGTSYSYTISGSISATWVATGGGTLSAIKFWLNGSSDYYNREFRVTITGGGSTVTATGAVLSTAPVEKTVAFSTPLKVRGSTVYTVTLTDISNNGGFGMYSTQSKQLGFYLFCAPDNGAMATMTALPRSTGLTGTCQALAWVRHGGGTVGLSLNGTAMAETSQRSTVNLRGESCTETAFYLETVTGDTLAPTLALNAGNAASMLVYDYGVALL